MASAAAAKKWPRLFQCWGKVHEQYIGCPFVFDFNAHDSRKSADSLIKVLAEFAEHHDAEVMAGKRTSAIAPRKDFFRRLAAGQRP
jgi:hypothetical protein